MLKNVNLLQNPKDITFDKYSEQYVLEALANLGQRIGIKGDGISYRSFTFILADICNGQSHVVGLCIITIKIAFIPVGDFTGNFQVVLVFGNQSYGSHVVAGI